MIRVRNPQDVAAGLFFILVGIAAFTLVWDLPMGRPVRMGPGYIPTLLGYILVFLGAIVAGKGLMADGPGLAAWALKPLCLILGAILVFAFLVEPAGLIITAVALIIVCSIAAPDARVVETGVFAVGLAVASTLLFKTLLQLPMSVWPQ